MDAESLSVEELAQLLAGTVRAERQEAARELARRADGDASEVIGAAPVLLDALTLPEPLTRWQCLNALTALVALDADVASGGFGGVEGSLFDEKSSAARLAAFRFLARYGATSAERSRKVWPLVNDAVQCYHGDSQYRDMLICLVDFAQGDVDAEVLEALAQRVAYDADNSQGYVRAYSAQIQAIAKERSQS